MFFIQTSKMLENSRTPYLFYSARNTDLPDINFVPNRISQDYCGLFLSDWIILASLFIVGLQCSISVTFFPSTRCCMYLTKTDRVNFRSHWVCDMLFQHQLFSMSVTFYYGKIAVSIPTKIFVPLWI